MALSLAGFLLLARAVAAGELADADLAILAAVHRWTAPWLTLLLRLVTYSASGAASTVIVPLISLWLWRRTGRLEQALLLAASVGLSAGAGGLLKLVFMRPRPSFFAPLTAATGYSFPSGHTLNAVVLAGLLGLLAAQGRSRRARVVIAVLVACSVGLVGLSRVYLGVHYPSDVLGSVLFGVAWLLGTCYLFARLCDRAHGTPRPE